MRRTTAGAVSALAAAVAVACGADPVAAPMADTPCVDPQRHLEPAPAAMLADHVAMLASIDGLTVSDAIELGQGLSVPDGVWFDDTLHVYAVAAEDHTIQHLVVGDDGTVGNLGSITVDGREPFSGMVDPDLHVLPDGTLRLLVLDGFPPRHDEEHLICVLDSSDGHAFTTVGTAFTHAKVYDPSVVAVDDGFLLAVGTDEMTTIVAWSPDGLDYVERATLEGSVPDLSRQPDGSVRLLTCTRDGVLAYGSLDSAASWSDLGQLDFAAGTPRGCDPSTVADTDWFVYKTFPPS